MNNFFSRNLKNLTTDLYACVCKKSTFYLAIQNLTEGALLVQKLPFSLTARFHHRVVQHVHRTRPLFVPIGCYEIIRVSHEKHPRLLTDLSQVS